MMILFRLIRDRPISRKVVADVAAQLDPTRRVRADKSRGTRNVLLDEGIVVFSGANGRDQQLLAELKLPAIGRTEYLSHRFDAPAERAIAVKYGILI